MTARAPAQPAVQFRCGCEERLQLAALSAAERAFDKSHVLEGWMATRSFDFLDLPGAPRRIVVLTAGSGSLVLELLRRYPASTMVVGDPSDAVLQRCRRRLGSAAPGCRSTFVRLESGQGVRHLGRADLVTSGPLDEPSPGVSEHLREVAALLGRGGRCLVTGFGSQNLRELAGCLERMGLPWRSGPTLQSLERSAARVGLQLCRADRLEQRLRYHSVEAFFHAAQQTLDLRSRLAGLGPSGTAALKAAYQRRYASDSGVGATWAPWFAVLRKI